MLKVYKINYFCIKTTKITNLLTLFRRTEKYLYHLLSIAIMSYQLNLRVNGSFLADLDQVSEFINVGKSDWARIKLAEAVAEEKRKMMAEIGRRYLCYIISDKEYERLTGAKPDPQLKAIREVELREYARRSLHIVAKDAEMTAELIKRRRK